MNAIRLVCVPKGNITTVVYLLSNFEAIVIDHGRSTHTSLMRARGYMACVHVIVVTAKPNSPLYLKLEILVFNKATSWCSGNISNGPRHDLKLPNSFADPSHRW
jgi:hypothetical protein